MKRVKLALAPAVIALLILLPGSAHALNQVTHRLINRAAAEDLAFDSFLRTQLGMSRGITQSFKGETVAFWIGEGGVREDDRIRFFRHFHDPLQPWGSAGLFLFDSSIRWMQLVDQPWSWPKARQYFHTALTHADPGTREQAFADTFRALGQIMHLVVDGSVPEHVRNDPHPLGPVYGNYEYWVSDQQAVNEVLFRDTYLSSPIGFEPNILQQATGDSLAPVPIARLIDTDRYTGVDPNVTFTVTPTGIAGAAIGIAEVANANFFSEDTGSRRLLLPNYPFPDVDGLVPSQHPGPRPPHVRAYYAKRTGDGLPIDPVLVECVLDEAASDAGLLEPPTYRCTDENVWAQTAQAMLPRAVGYAKGLLDYFFRGTLNFTIAVSATNPTQNQLTITNTSAEAMAGTFTLYADNFSDVRSPVEGASFDLSLGPGATSAPLSFTPPAQVRAYVLVFRGRLGNEDGAVTGRVKEFPVNSLFVWQVRFYNDQFDLVHLFSAFTGACFIRTVESLSSSGTHAGVRRAYLFFAFVNDPNLPLSPLDISALRVTVQLKPATGSSVNYTPFGASGFGAVGIIRGAGGKSCGNQFFPYAPKVTEVFPAEVADPSFFGPNPIPPPSHYVFVDDAEAFLHDTGVAASPDILLTQRVTRVSWEELQRIAQGLHPLLTPPPSFPRTSTVYAFAQFDIPNVDSWVVSDSNKAVWAGTSAIASASVAEMWDVRNLTLRVNEDETNIPVSLVRQRIKRHELNLVFGTEYRRTEQRNLESFTLRFNPNDPFNPIREGIP